MKDTFASRLHERCWAVSRTLGVRKAAAYLRNRGITFPVAHFMVIGYWPRYDRH